MGGEERKRGREAHLHSSWSRLSFSSARRSSRSYSSCVCTYPRVPVQYTNTPRIEHAGRTAVTVSYFSRNARNLHAVNLRPAHAPPSARTCPCTASRGVPAAPASAFGIPMSPCSRGACTERRNAPSCSRTGGTARSSLLARRAWALLVRSSWCAWGRRGGVVCSLGGVPWWMAGDGEVGARGDWGHEPSTSVNTGRASESEGFGF